MRDNTVSYTEYVVELEGEDSAKRLGTFNTYEEADEFMDTIVIRFIDYNRDGDEVAHGLVV